MRNSETQVPARQGSLNIGFKVTQGAQLRSFHSDTTERPETPAHLNPNSLRPGSKDPADSSIPRPLGAPTTGVRCSRATIKALRECPTTDNSHMGLPGPSARWVSPPGPLKPNSSSAHLAIFTRPLPGPQHTCLFSCIIRTQRWVRNQHHPSCSSVSLPTPDLLLHPPTPRTIPSRSGPCLQDCARSAGLRPNPNPTCSPHQPATAARSPGKASPLVPPPDPLPPPHPSGSLHGSRAGQPRAPLHRAGQAEGPQARGRERSPVLRPWRCTAAALALRKPEPRHPGLRPGPAPPGPHPDLPAHDLAAAPSSPCARPPPPTPAGKREGASPSSGSASPRGQSAVPGARPRPPHRAPAWGRRGAAGSRASSGLRRRLLGRAGRTWAPAEGRARPRDAQDPPRARPLTLGRRLPTRLPTRPRPTARTPGSPAAAPPRPASPSERRRSPGAALPEEMPPRPGRRPPSRPGPEWWAGSHAAPAPAPSANRGSARGSPAPPPGHLRAHWPETRPSLAFPLSTPPSGPPRAGVRKLRLTLGPAPRPSGYLDCRPLRASAASPLAVRNAAGQCAGAGRARPTFPRGARPSPPLCSCPPPTLTWRGSGRADPRAARQERIGLAGSARHCAQSQAPRKHAPVQGPTPGGPDLDTRGPSPAPLPLTQERTRGAPGQPPETLRPPTPERAETSSVGRPGVGMSRGAAEGAEPATLRHAKRCEVAPPGDGGGSDSEGSCGRGAAICTRHGSGTASQAEVIWARLQTEKKAGIAAAQEARRAL